MKLPYPERFPWVTLGRRESTGEVEARWRLERACAEKMPGRPLVSWILSGEASYLRPLVAAQTYDRCEVVEAAAGEFAASLNEAARRSTGEWLIFAGSDDRPAPFAVFQWLRESAEADLIFSDEAVLEGDRLKAIWTKPALSRWNALHFDPVGRAWMIHRAVFEFLGGFADLPERDARQDLWLRFLRSRHEAHHVPGVLWYGPDRTVPPLSPALSSRSAKAAAAWGVPGDSTRPSVSALIPFRDKGDWTVRCVESLLGQRNLDLELILVDNASDPEERRKVKECLDRSGRPHHLLSVDGEFRFARMNNAAARAATGRFLLFLNNDVFLSDPDTVRDMARWAATPGVGTVGCVLKYPDGRVQHDGIRARTGSGGRTVAVGHQGDLGPFRGLIREVFANTFAASLMERDRFLALERLDELNWVNGFGDVVFQLRARRQGLRHLILGHREAVHLESGSRGLSYEYWEERSLERHFPGELQEMLHSDLSWSAPGGLVAVRRAILETVASQARERFPELVLGAKKLLSGWKARENNPIS